MSIIMTTMMNITRKITTNTITPTAMMMGVMMVTMAIGTMMIKKALAAR